MQDIVMEQLKAAMKAKDTTALNTLRALKTALTNAAIEKGGLGTNLDEKESLAVVQKQIKQRRDSIQQFEQAGRQEMADTEAAEIAILEAFMPKQLTPEELSEIVAATISETGASSRADMGRVMGAIQAKVAGQAEGKLISGEVMKQLS